MISKEKQRNQVKSKFYYIFWGVATVSVVLGQIYVGSGYRGYNHSINQPAPEQRRVVIVFTYS